MKKVFGAITIVALILGIFFRQPPQIFATDCFVSGIKAEIVPKELTEEVNTSLSVSFEGLAEGKEYTVAVTEFASIEYTAYHVTGDKFGNGIVVFTESADKFPFTPGAKTVSLNKGLFDACDLGTYVVKPASSTNSCALTVTYNPAYTPICADVSTSFSVSFTNTVFHGSLYTGNVRISGAGFENSSGHVTNGSLDSPVSLGPYSSGKTFTITVDAVRFPFLREQLCTSGSISTVESCQNQAQVPGSGLLVPYDPTCGPGESGIKTGLGCLPTNPQAFVNTALPWAIGIGAGLAFLLGIYGALMIVISAGNPEKMQAGRELITSAISGLLIIIFAIFLLKVIGVDILNLFPEATRTGGGGGGRPPVAM